MAKGKQLESFNTAYKQYKEETDNPVSLKEFITLSNKFAQFIKDELLNGEIVLLPRNLGILQVIGREKKVKVDKDGKITGLSVDWGSTRRLWKECEKCKKNKQLIHFFNEHSDGVGYRIIWSRLKTKIFNKRYYTFIPAKAVKRELSRKILEEGKEYLIVESKSYIPKVK